MDFAQKQMEKYGWRRGSGMGKNEDGMTSAVKVKIKQDVRGLGHNMADEFTTGWWQQQYNDIAQRLKTGEISSSKVGTATQLYGNFVKSATLLPGGEVPETPPDDVTSPAPVTSLSDEALVAACEGRTAHKGARHGLRLNGKLARIEAQERRANQGAGHNATSQSTSASDSEPEIRARKSKGSVSRDNVQVADALSRTLPHESEKIKKKKKRIKDSNICDVSVTKSDDVCDHNMTARKKKRKRTKEGDVTRDNYDVTVPGSADKAAISDPVAADSERVKKKKKTKRKTGVCDAE